MLGVKAWVLAMQGYPEEMGRAVDRLHELGGLDEGPLPDGMASLESSLSLLSAIFGGGDVTTRLEDGTRAAALEGPDSPWYPVATWALGWAHYCVDELELAEQRFKETVALGPPVEQWLVASASIAQLSMIAGMRGRIGEQVRLADEAYEMAREHGLLDAIEGGEVPTARGLALAARGEFEAALPELEKGLMLRRIWGQPFDPADGLIALATVTAASGDRARANELFDEAEAILAGCPIRVAPPPARGRAACRPRRRGPGGAERARAHRAPDAARRKLGARDRPGAVPLVQHGAHPREVDLSQAGRLLARRRDREGARAAVALIFGLGESGPR